MNKFKILSNNALKIIACISMLIDHIAIFFFPNIIILRIIGRISYPIFAFCLVEGCIYTNNRIKHLLLIAFFGCAMLVGSYVFANISDFNIFISFALSIIMIYLIDNIDGFIRIKRINISILLIFLLILIITGINVFIYYFPNFDNNYGFFGIITPVLMYIVKKYLKDNKWCLFIELSILAILIVIRTIVIDNYLMLFSLISIFIIMMYNEKKGVWKIKYLFYIFYPLHFIILYAIALLVE